LDAQVHSCCKDAKLKKNASKTRITDSGELDEHALIGDLRRVVEESELSIPKKRLRADVCG
jgi:hypothetical protein